MSASVRSPRFLIALTLLSAGIAPRSAVADQAATSAPTRPNIIFILADDLGINDLGCYGRTEHRTPNLDRLAKSGARFTEAYAAASICSPTRAAFITGQAPARLHLTTFLPGRADAPSQKLLHPKIAMGLPKALKTLPECLQETGYATGCAGKWHLGNRGSQPADHGFDVYTTAKSRTEPSATEGSKGEYELTEKAVRFIEANKSRPFFLFLAHNTPHIPYASSEERIRQNANAHEPAYAGVIESMDDTIGRLMAKLDELKLTDNTLVIFSSDNGGLSVPELNHQKITHCSPFRAGKGYLYEGGIRVPLIARWPGKISAGLVVSIPVITTDWCATICDLAGAKPPPLQDGISLAALLRGENLPPARPLYWHQPHYVNQGGRPSGAVRDGQWKLIEYYDTGKTELYNLATDPSENNDLSSHDAARTATMKQQLADWLKSVDAQTMQPNPDFDPALFHKLYVDVDPSRYNSSTTDESGFRRMQDWRKLMDEVVRKPKSK